VTPGQLPRRHRPGPAAWISPALRRRAATTTAGGLLAAASVTWAAIPMRSAGAGSRPVLTIAIICAVLSIVRLAAGEGQAGEPAPFEPWPVRHGRELMALVRAVPWAEAMIVAVLALEALHGARAWHTGVLGAALLACLLAVHLAESGQDPATLRGQLPLAAAGLGLLILAVGSAAIGAPAGPGAGWFRTLAAIAAVAAAALALPV
jgi:hypothetical protein